MDNLKYSIIFAVIRPEISEQVSVGLILVEGEKVEVRYSKTKLNSIQSLFSEEEYNFVSRVVTNMKQNGNVNSIADINYLSRYSNNLIAFSPLQSIDLAPTESNKRRLYQKYVYKPAKAV